uniref:Uncharacterized protein n=1 Tax=Nelumbo nucifera TaxID=4432 RepID=A0A822XTT0_NELNU|nr:TPA_asm: hypothetical protein HUJ06_024044 [Nelumbo nucifera]
MLMSALENGALVVWPSGQSSSSRIFRVRLRTAEGIGGSDERRERGFET